MAMCRTGGLLVFVLLGGIGCSARDDSLWYKPGRDYTMAEFKRDRDACTKGNVFDPGCMKARGWVAVNPDRSPPPPLTPSRRPGY